MSVFWHKHLFSLKPPTWFMRFIERSSIQDFPQYQRQGINIYWQKRLNIVNVRITVQNLRTHIPRSARLANAFFGDIILNNGVFHGAPRCNKLVLLKYVWTHAVNRIDRPKSASTASFPLSATRTFADWKGFFKWIWITRKPLCHDGQGGSDDIQMRRAMSGWTRLPCKSRDLGW